MLCYLVLSREVCFHFIYSEYTIMHCHIDISKMASLSVKRSFVSNTSFIYRLKRSGHKGLPCCTVVIYLNSTPSLTIDVLDKF